MSWLAKLAPFRKGGLAVAEAGANGGIDGAGRRETSGPPLMCLVNDASGRASFKTHTFADVESATDFVLYWFPNQSQGGIIAFWAMTEEPFFGLDDPSESTAEPLVMIRDVTRDGVVYLFSFSDIDSAQAFLRDEVQHGTDMGSMMLYWAVPVRIAADPWGKMVLTPSVAPGRESEIETRAPISDTWSPPPVPPTPQIKREEPEEDARAVFEEAPNAHTGVADPMGGIDDSFELTAWMERARKKPSHEREAAASEWSRRLARDVQKPRTKSRPEPSLDDTPPAREPIESIGEASAAPVVSARDEELPRTAENSPTVAEEPPTEMESVIEAAIEESAIIADAVEAPAEIEATPAAEATQPEAAQKTNPEEKPAQVEPAVEDDAVEVRQTTARINTNGNGHKSSGRVVEEHASVELTLEGAEFVVRQNGRPSVEHPVADEATTTANEKSGPDAEQTQLIERRAKPNGRRAGDAPERRRAGHGADATAEARTHASTDANGSEETVEIRIDIHLESSKAMKVKRWEVKEEPFDGFNSPPGRF